MITNPRDKLTEREREEMQFAKEENEENRKHVIQVKDQEYKLEKLRLQWRQIWYIPRLVLMLPVLVVLGAGLAVAVSRGKKVPQDYWSLLQV